MKICDELRDVLKRPPFFDVVGGCGMDTSRGENPYMAMLASGSIIARSAAERSLPNTWRLRDVGNGTRRMTMWVRIRTAPRKFDKV